MIGINRNPSPRELRWFGALLPLFAVLLAAVLYLQWQAPQAARTVCLVGAILTLGHFLVPAARRPFYLGWMYAVLPIGWLVSHLLLALIYYLVLTPIGLIMRLVGRDPMQRRFQSREPTYWVSKEPPGDFARYFRQF